MSASEASRKARRQTGRNSLAIGASSWRPSTTLEEIFGDVRLTWRSFATVARNLIIRPDVRRRLGVDGVRVVKEGPLVNRVECFVCGKEEALDSGVQMTVSVVVAHERDKESVRTQFAHPKCASSSVLAGHPEHESDLASELIWRAMVRGPQRMPILVYGPDSILMGREARDGPLVEAWTDYFRRLGLVSLKGGDAIPAGDHEI